MSIDLSPEEFRALGYQAVDMIAEQLAGIRQAPVRQPMPEIIKTTLMEQLLPQFGTAPEALLDRFAQEVQPYPMGNSSPRFMGWVNSTAAPLGMIADMLAAALNPSVAGGDHAATYVEHAVLTWMKDIMGYPHTAGGVLTSGGSVANLVCLGAMRHAITQQQDRTSGFYTSTAPYIIYISTEGHSCIQKAVEILGFGSQNIRKIPVDEAFRFDIAALRQQIIADRQAGLHPACVAASAGTVNTGAIDPLDEIADLCASEGLWFHIDGSYGGAGIMAEQTTGLYRGIERADSLAIDQHKWLFIPVECGCALVKDAALMRDSYSLVPSYLRDDRSLPWFSEFGIQQSRGFRALKLWMVMQQVGVAGYREIISQNITLTQILSQKIASRPDFELVATGPLSVACFRYMPAGVQDVDAFNRALVPIIQNSGQAFITSAELNGRPVLRSCIVNFRTTESDLDALLQAVVTAGEMVVSP